MPKAAAARHADSARRHECDHGSPLFALLATPAACDLSKAPSREAFLSISEDPVVAKTGIAFQDEIWWASDLDRLTTLPPSSKGKRPKMQIRYDAAAARRRDLAEITVVVLDEHGRVRDRVRCVPRADAQEDVDRDVNSAKRARYEATLLTRRERRERQADAEGTGFGAGSVKDSIEHARRKQGRPGEYRTGGAYRPPKSDATPTAGSAEASNSAPTSAAPKGQQPKAKRGKTKPKSADAASRSSTSSTAGAQARSGGGSSRFDAYNARAAQRHDRTSSQAGDSDRT